MIHAALRCPFVTRPPEILLHAFMFRSCASFSCPTLLTHLASSDGIWQKTSPDPPSDESQMIAAWRRREEDGQSGRGRRGRSQVWQIERWLDAVQVGGHLPHGGDKWRCSVRWIPLGKEWFRSVSVQLPLPLQSRCIMFGQRSRIAVEGNRCVRRERFPSISGAQTASVPLRRPQAANEALHNCHA